MVTGWATPAPHSSIVTAATEMARTVMPPTRTTVFASSACFVALAPIRMTPLLLQELPGFSTNAVIVADEEEIFYLRQLSRLGRLAADRRPDGQFGFQADRSANTVTCAALAVVERILKLKNTRRLHKRVKHLESKIDHHRSTSNLITTGHTNPVDRI
jgi:hypothetical protein